MGLFSLFRRKSKNQFSQMTIEEAMNKYGVEEDNLSDLEVIHRVEQVCLQIKDAEYAFEEAKNEYGAISSYLSDIQKIDALSGEQRQGIEDAAGKIINFSKERKRFQEEKHSIRKEQYLYLKQFEQELPGELARMKQQEEFLGLVKEDLRNLEGEKGIQSYERENALERIGFLKRFSIVLCILSVLTFGTLIVVSDMVQKDFTLPFFTTGLMILAMILYVILESRNSVFRLKMAEIKLNKVIALTNRVKIKYINSTNVIEYAYEKYQVNSYQELEYLFKEYTKRKDEEEKYKKNTELLETYNQLLVDELKEFGIEDANIWLCQPEALLNKKEMVEVRHHLNKRRQKLREQIEVLGEQRDLIKNNLISMEKRFSEYQDAIHEMMRYHNLF